MLALATGSKSRIVVIAIWLAAAVLGFIGQQRLGDVTAAGQRSFLPRSSESTKAAGGLQGFRGGNDVPALVVFARDGGLTGADRAAIGRIGTELEARRLAGATPVVDPFVRGEAGSFLSQAGLVAGDGSAAIVALGIDADVRNATREAVADIRELLDAEAPPGLRAHVAGPAGTAADLEAEADAAGRTLLFATLGLVLVLLLLVYRAPVLAVLPLGVVAVAYLIAYLLIRSGAIEVNSEGTMLLIVLVFGAGTDYSLLLVQRYREELAEGGDTTEALQRAVRASAPAIAASAGTVMAALLVLLLADLESTHWLGPVLAIGVAVTLLASFTLLPACLALLGPRAFWPAGPVRTPRRASVWERVAALVSRRARLLVVAITAFLVIASLGNLVATESIGFGQGFTRQTDSTRGIAILDARFPPGLSSPVSVLVGDQQADAVVDRLRRLPSVETAVPAGASQASGRVLIAAILRVDPDSFAAANAVREIRRALEPVAPDALVGGITAENVDIERTNAQDTRLIVPVTLVVVGLILVLLLRAVVAPLYLMVTVALSFAATMGLATVGFTKVLGEDGLTFNLVLLAFIFLIALGVDYNIFLMHRAREESRVLGTRKGILRALVTTGGVVTGAGIILAGTFATLTVLPLEALVQIGGTIALGVLLDTFLVRALLVPAITQLVGDRAWWPSRLAKVRAPGPLDLGDAHGGAVGADLGPGRPEL